MTFSNDAKLSDLKAFIAEHNIPVLGNRTMKRTYLEAIDAWNETRALAAEMADESELQAAKASEAIEVAVVKAHDAITAPEAIALYRAALKYTLVVMVFSFLAAQWAMGELWAGAKAIAASEGVQSLLADVRASDGAIVVCHCFALVAMAFEGEASEVAVEVAIETEAKSMGGVPLQ